MNFYPHDTRSAQFFSTALRVWPVIAVGLVVLLHFAFHLDLATDLLLGAVFCCIEGLIGLGYLGMGKYGVQVQEAGILVQKVFYKTFVPYEELSCVCIGEWFPWKAHGDHDDFRICVLSKKFDKAKLEQNAVEEYVGRGKYAGGAQVVSVSFTEAFFRAFFSHCRCPLYLSAEVYQTHGDEILRILNHDDTKAHMQARQTLKNYRIQ